VATATVNADSSQASPKRSGVGAAPKSRRGRSSSVWAQVVTQAYNSGMRSDRRASLWGSTSAIVAR
jgi:hypothetical protein